MVVTGTAVGSDGAAVISGADKGAETGGAKRKE